MTSRETRASDLKGSIRQVLWTGVVLGIGLMGAIDEIVFHQLLQWHHFYLHTTEYWRIFSDGLFHVFTTTMLFLGALLLWFRREQLSLIGGNRALWASILLGAGGFQLFDGTVNHKLLRLHPVREGAQSLLPYDLGWNASGLLLLLIGWLLWRGVSPTETR